MKWEFINRNLKLSQLQNDTRLKIYITILYYELYFTDAKLGQIENRIYIW
jgi:hypothetical protein